MKYYGRIEHIPGKRLHLELDGYFDMNLDSGKIEVIHGISEDTEEVTLFGCLQTNMDDYYTAGYRYVKSDLNIERIIYGNHFLNDEISFNKSVLRFPFLEIWRMTRTARSAYSEEDRAWSQKYELPENTEYIIDGFGRLSFSTSVSTENTRESSKLNHKQYLIFKRDDNTDLTILGKIISNIQKLIILSIDRPISIEEIEFNINIDQVSQESSLVRSDMVRYIYQPVYFVSLDKVRMSGLIPLPLDLIMRHIKNPFNKWFGICEKFKTAFIWYFDNELRPEKGKHEVFLSYLRALDSYHVKSRMRNWYEPANVARARKERIKASLQTDDRIWVFNKLQFAFSNEPSLRLKILRIITKFNYSIPFVAKKEYGNLAKSIIDTRNFLIHSNERGNILDRIEMVFVNHIMATLFKAAILHEFGIPLPIARNQIQLTRCYQTAKIIKEDHHIDFL